MCYQQNAWGIHSVNCDLRARQCSFIFQWCAPVAVQIAVPDSSHLGMMVYYLLPVLLYSRVAACIAKTRIENTWLADDASSSCACNGATARVVGA